MSLISVEEALAPRAGERARRSRRRTCRSPPPGRTLAADVAALRTQPPFAASAMDGYAVRAADVARGPATLSLVGASAARARGFAARSDPARRCGSSPARPFPRAPTPS